MRRATLVLPAFYLLLSVMLVLSVSCSSGSGPEPGPATTATPVYNHDAGTYSNDVSVIISDATSGATIKYCMDTAGTCKPSAGTAYTGPIAITATGTHLRSYAVHSGSSDSATKDAVYTLQVAAPSILPNPSNPTTLAFSSSTIGVTYHYTSDGSTNPTCSTGITGNSYAIYGSVELRVIACKANYLDSSLFTNGFTTVQFKIGDAPADRALAFSATLNSFTATTGSQTISLINSPVTLEFTHMAGTMELLQVVPVPCGMYTAFNYSVSNIKARTWNPGTSSFADYAEAGPVNGSIPATPVITVAVTPIVINLDLDLQNSISFDTSNNLMINPQFSLAANLIDSESAQLAETGLANDLVGIVTSVSEAGFSMQIPSGGIVTVRTDASTSGPPVSGAVVDDIVSVDAITVPDGTLLARRIDFVESGFIILVEGFVTSMDSGRYGGNSATLHVDRVWNPDGVLAPAIGDDFTLTGLQNSEVEYEVDSELLDSWSNGAVTFDATHFGVGQRVQALGAPATVSAAANKIRLVEIIATGTVQDYDPGSIHGFTLRVDIDSAIQNAVGLMPTTYLTVWDQSEGKTTFQGFPAGTPMQNGMRVRVRGPAFWFWLLGYTPGGTTVIPTRIDYLPLPPG